MAQYAQWTCDRCSHTTTIANDGLMPLNWCHSMGDQDLCPDCRTD